MATQQIKLEWNGSKVSKAMMKEARTRVYAASEYFRDALVKKLSGSRSGRSYRVPGTSTTYTASAPGQPPAVATGRLRQSVKTEIDEGKDYVESRTGTDLDYGRYLETGTRHMRPRPWLKPTFDEEESKLKKIIGGQEWTL